MDTHSDIQRLLNDLRRRIAGVARRYELTGFLHRATIAVAGVIVTAAVLLFAEIIGYLPSEGRTVLVFAFLLGVIPAALFFIAPPLLRAIGLLSGRSTGQTARMIGEQYPLIRDRLRNIMQLGETRAQHAWVSSELIEDAIRTLHEEIHDVDLSDAVDREPMLRTMKRAGIVSSFAIVLMLLWPGRVTDAFGRYLNYDQDYTRPRVFSFYLEPGNTEIAKGSDVSLQVSVSATDDDELPDAIDLFLRGEGQTRYERTQLRAAGNGRFVHELPGIRYSHEYYAAIGDERSDAFLIRVLDWPSFQEFRVRLDHPAYSRIPVLQQEEFSGDVSALPGTRVTVSGRASKELAEGRVLFDDSSSVALEIDGDRFRASFMLSRAGSYTVNVTDEKGLTNRAPIPYQLRLRPDANPAVEITQPGRNVDVANNEPFGLFVEARDDFGVSALVLRYRLSQSNYVQVSDRFESIAIPVPSGDPRDISLSYLWDLDPLDLVPEDVVEYFVEVYDNDSVNGPKSSRSRTYTLRLPSLEEVFADVESGHEQALEDLDQAREDAEQLRDDIEEINRDLKTNKEFDWQDQQKAEEMAKKVEDIQQRLQQTEQQLKAMTDEMQRQEVLSTETLEKYLELQSLFQEMNTQELQQALRQMQQAMEGVRRDQMQQAMQQLEFSEERFRQGIERTLNLLKRIQIEQRMDEAKTRAEDLAQQQENLQDASERSSEDRARDQESLAADQERLEEILKELQRRMEEFFTEMPADQLSELNRSLEQQQLQQQMKDAAQMMRGGQQQQAQQSQQQIQQSLENMFQQLQAMQQQMLQQQTDQILNSLRRATTDLLELSQRQEQVKNDARSSPNSSPSLRQNAQQQMQIMRELNNIAASLSELAQKSFAVTPEMGRSIGEAMQSMEDAMRDLDVRNGSQASLDQTGAMSSLNEAAQQVQQSLQMMMQGAQGAPGGMGLMQQLQMMAGRQMQLNAQTQRMGERPGESEQMRRAAEAARIAREQDAVRKSLQQLQREAEASGDGDRILGDLDRIANEMREVVRNLEQNNVNDETIRRQEQILSRLLDASRSMRERDFEKRRESRSGQRFTRRGPESLPAEETQNWLRQEMLRALEKGYSRDYQELIRKYFEELERLSDQSD